MAKDIYDLGVLRHVHDKHGLSVIRVRETKLLLFIEIQKVKNLYGKIENRDEQFILFQSHDVKTKEPTNWQFAIKIDDIVSIKSWF